MVPVVKFLVWSDHEDSPQHFVECLEHNAVEGLMSGACSEACALAWPW